MTLDEVIFGALLAEKNQTHLLAALTADTAAKKYQKAGRPKSICVWLPSLKGVSKSRAYRLMDLAKAVMLRFSIASASELHSLLTSKLDDLTPGDYAVRSNIELFLQTKSRSKIIEYWKIQRDVPAKENGKSSPDSDRLFSLYP